MREGDGDMKIILLSALKEWITKEYGAEKWKEIAETTGLGVDQFREQDKYFSDDRFSMLIANIANAMSIDEKEVSDKFVNYWMLDFAGRLYQLFVKRSATAKEFVVSIFQINNDVCKLFPNKLLTKVDYKETDRQCLTAVYPNEKSLVDIVAVLRGINIKKFPDKFTIRKINQHSIEIKFEKVEEV